MMRKSISRNCVEGVAVTPAAATAIDFARWQASVARYVPGLRVLCSRRAMLRWHSRRFRKCEVLVIYEQTVAQ